MATNAINTQCEGQSETDLCGFEGYENVKNAINTQCGAVLSKCKIIAGTYGHEPQSRMLQEEAAELIQAVSKYYRSARPSGLKDSKAADNLVEECADTVIMIIQELMFLQIDPELFMGLITEKLDRQIHRMKGEGR